MRDAHKGSSLTTLLESCEKMIFRKTFLHFPKEFCMLFCRFANYFTASQARRPKRQADSEPIEGSLVSLGRRVLVRMRLAMSESNNITW